MLNAQRDRTTQALSIKSTVMKKLLTLLTICIITNSAISQTATTTNAELNNHIKQLLELTGSAKLGIQFMNNMLAAFKKQAPQVPAEFWDEVSKTIKAEELVEIIIPIYAKYYTDEDVTKMIEFYQTPTGKKVIETLPLITQDSYVAGEEWGKKIAERIVERLKAKGYVTMR